jgi:threonylcarbamoyladenosine tRNA methylthiotransferase MtaB
LINAGYKEIVVSGINLSDYKNENKRFIDLVKMLAVPNKYFISSDIRFRISSIEPQVINEELIEIIAESNTICPHFHIPLQSGCDEVLKKMQRRYNTTQFRNVIELVNKYMPSAFIGLDVISGFPTERDDNFIETKDFISSLNISKLHCFTYSMRQGTIAATMQQIPKQIKKARTKELLKLSENKHAEFNKNNIGNTFFLLPEKYDNTNKIAFGHTENYLEINIETDKKLENNFHKIVVKEIKNNKLFGKLLGLKNIFHQPTFCHFKLSISFLYIGSCESIS